jgi:hypothetical protein
MDQGVARALQDRPLSVITFSVQTTCPVPGKNLFRSAELGKSFYQRLAFVPPSSGFKAHCRRSKETELTAFVSPLLTQKINR